MSILGYSLTGVDFSLHKGMVLDTAMAFRALKDLQQRVIAVERLIEQLSPWDDTEVFDHVSHKTIIRKNRRLVSQQVAEALSSVCPERRLFLTWDEWRAKRQTFKYTNRKKPGNETYSNTQP